jgi:hypothetical protein
MSVIDQLAGWSARATTPMRIDRSAAFELKPARGNSAATVRRGKPHRHA